MYTYYIPITHETLYLYNPLVDTMINMTFQSFYKSVASSIISYIIHILCMLYAQHAAFCPYSVMCMPIASSYCINFIYLYYLQLFMRVIGTQAEVLISYEYILIHRAVKLRIP